MFWPREIACMPFEDSLIIISAINSRNEIYSQLRKDERLFGVTVLKDFGFLFGKVDYEDRCLNEIWNEYLKHEEEILSVFDMLEDFESCFIYYRIFVNRITRKDTFWDIYSADQYFIPEIREKLRDNEVFVDCGSYIGETLEDLKKYTSNRFLKAYAFELDKNNFKKLLKCDAVSDNRVVLFNVGVGNKNQTIEYAQFNDRGGSCGFAFAEHDLKLGARLVQAKVRTVDAMISDKIIKEKITFVKMDIEGAEMEALNGMSKMISQYVPKLAICIYHKPEDMWEIPMFIKSIVPTYRFLIRHHDFADNETVLYAIPRE